MNWRNRFNKRYFLTTILPVAVVILATLASIYFINRQTDVTLGSNQGVSYERAVVTQVFEENLTEEDISGAQTGTQEVELQILSGPYKGETYRVTNYATYTYNVVCEPGTRVIVVISTAGSEQLVNVYTYDRSIPLFVIIGLFALTLCVIGGWKGIKSLLGLAFTFFCIILVFIPLLYRGLSPIWGAILLAIAATFVTMMLIDGWNAKTVSAIIGTILCVSIAGLISTAVGHFAHISGFTMADTEELVVVARRSGMQLQGIMFASILISSLGAIMDVCMSISTSLNEILEHNPHMTRFQLFRSGINVGRDMMGTMSNTLILAFTGGSLTSLLMLKAYGISFNQLFSSPSIATEIIQGMAGSMGVFLAVPIVALIAAQLLTWKKKEHPAPQEIPNGQDTPALEQPAAEQQ